MTVEVWAVRMSGEMTTSLGNGFANLVTMKFVCHVIGSTCVGVVEGDDGLFRIDGAVPPNIIFEQMGLRIKLKRHTSIEEASFCGCVFVNGENNILTDPISTLTDFGWTQKRYLHANRATLRCLLRSKALSLAHQYPGCPILSVWARRIMKYTAGCRGERGLVGLSLWDREQYKIAARFPLDKLYVEPSIRARQLVASRYNIPVEVQLYTERQIDLLTDNQLDEGIALEKLMEHVPEYAKSYYENYSVDEEVFNGWKDDKHLSMYELTVLFIFYLASLLLNWRRQKPPI
jgi:hypothetical protein